MPVVLALEDLVVFFCVLSADWLELVAAVDAFDCVALVASLALVVASDSLLVDADVTESLDD